MLGLHAIRNNMLYQLGNFISRRTWYAWAMRVAICWFGILLIGSFIGSATLWLFPVSDPEAMRQLIGVLHFALAVGAILSWVVIYYFVRACFRVLDRRDVRELRMDIDQRTPAFLLAGCLAALLMLALVFGFQYAAGWIVIKSITNPLQITFLSAVFSSLIQFATVGVTEEIRYRAYGYASGEGAMPLPLLVLVNALLFGLMHLQYEQFGIIAIMNLMIIACFYFASLHWFGSIWFGVGFHVVWDFAQVSIFGLAFAGSGEISLIMIEQKGPSLWVGGTALIEAGLTYALVFLVATGLVLKLYRRAQLPENSDSTQRRTK